MRQFPQLRICAIEPSNRDQAGIFCSPMMFHSVVFPAFAVLQMSVVFPFSPVLNCGLEDVYEIMKVSINVNCMV